MSPALVALVIHFSLLSLLAFGGVGALMPEIHRIVVEQQGWLTQREFVDYFAIAQAAPGPNVLFVTLIGWHVAGVVGALATTVAMALPGAVFTCIVVDLWQRFRDHPLRMRIQQGIAPLTVGLVCCTAWIMIRLADHQTAAYALTVGAALLSWRTSVNPLWLLAAGALLGTLGYV